MLRTFFGSYSGLNVHINKNSKVIDIGCSFGNDLIPFLDIGVSVYGVELDEAICNITKKILKKNLPLKNLH